MSDDELVVAELMEVFIDKYQGGGGIVSVVCIHVLIWVHFYCYSFRLPSGTPSIITHTQMPSFLLSGFMLKVGSYLQKHLTYLSCYFESLWPGPTRKGFTTYLQF